MTTQQIEDRQEIADPYAALNNFRYMGKCDVQSARESNERDELCERYEERLFGR